MLFKGKVNRVRRLFMHSLTRTIGQKDDMIGVNNPDIVNVLICRPNSRLGNQLLITPVIQDISSYFPNCKIDLFVRGGAAFAIFKNYRNIDRVIKLPQKPFRNIIQYLYVWCGLRQKNYDLVINIDHGSSSGKLATKLSKSKRKIFGVMDDELSAICSDYIHMAKAPVYNLTPIMGRITIGRSMSQFSLKLSCTPGLWNPRESRLDGKSREAVVTNAKIEKLLLAVHSAYDTLIERNQPFDAESVKNLFQGSMGAQTTLLALLDRHMEGLRARIGIDVAPTTLSGYVYTYRSLGKFIKKKFKTKDIAFGQLNEQFIREYQDFVLLKQGYSMDTVRHYLAILKKMCKIAFKEGISEKLHFAHYKLPKQKEATPKALSRESFEKIRDLEIAPNRHSHLLTRDLFLFACYTGTSYADIVRITEENLFTDEKDNLWLKYRRKKTDFQARVKLLPEAIALLEKYKDENRETLFPIQSAEVVQLNMRGLRVMADIKQPISYHSGRHSFATTLAF